MILHHCYLTLTLNLPYLAVSCKNESRRVTLIRLTPSNEAAKTPTPCY